MAIERDGRLIYGIDSDGVKTFIAEVKPYYSCEVGITLEECVSIAARLASIEEVERQRDVAEELLRNILRTINKAKPYDATKVVGVLAATKAAIELHFEENGKNQWLNID